MATIRSFNLIGRAGDQMANSLIVNPPCVNWSSTSGPRNGLAHSASPSARAGQARVVGSHAHPTNGEANLGTWMAPVNSYPRAQRGSNSVKLRRDRNRAWERTP